MSSSRLPPGGSWIPFLGDGLSLTKDPIGFLTARKDEHGPVFRVKLLGYDVAIIAGLPEFLEALKSDEFGPSVPKTSKETETSPSLSCERSLMGMIRNLYGPGPLISDGDQSIKLRLAMLNCLPKTTSYSNLLSLSADRLFSSLSKDEPISFYQVIKGWCTESLLCLLFGVDHELTSEFLQHTVVQFRAAISSPIKVPGFSYHAGFKARDMIKGELGREIHRALNRVLLHRLAKPSSLSTPDLTIHTKQACPFSSSSSDVLHETIPENDHIFVPAIDKLLDIYLNGEDGPFKLSMEDVELCLMWLSSNIIHKTTASTITSFVMHFEMGNPTSSELLTKLRAELDSLIKWDGNYMNACIKEVERLWPAVTMGCRGVISPIPINNYLIPVGWQLAWSTYLMNRDDRIFDEPNIFKPKRWLTSNSVINNTTFGHPQRQCPGTSIARSLCKIAISSLIQNYDWRLLPSQDRTLKSFPVLKPRGDCMLWLSPRGHSDPSAHSDG